MPLIRFAIANPLITNLMLVLVLLLGVLSWYAMPQEMFPLVAASITPRSTLACWRSGRSVIGSSTASLTQP